MLDPSPGRDYIAVVGASKTGTTGVYATIKHGLTLAGHRYACLFEPSSRQQLAGPFTYLVDEPLLIKTTMDRVNEVLPDPLTFDRRVITVRDPRDVLISALLFRPLTQRALARADDRAVEQFITAIARKERDPGSISVSRLFNLARRLEIGGGPYSSMVDAAVVQRELIARHDFHVVRYEDFVAGDLAALNDYLGVETVTPGVDPKQSTYGHIVRSRETGQFRRWFLPEDLERFNAMFAETLAAYGYDPAAPLLDEPSLDPTTGSQYLRDRYRQRRRRLSAVSGARDAVAESPAAITDLLDHAEDGDAWACLRVAEAYRGGAVVPHDIGLALHWARRSARLGLPDGMRLAADLLSGAGPHTAAARRERQMWLAAATDAAGPTGGRVRRLEQQVAALEGSASMQVGTQLVRAARDPRHEAVPAGRALFRLWRDRRSASD